MDHVTTTAGALDTPGVRYELRCWGTLEVHDRATLRASAPGSRKARAILAYLARQPDVPVSRDRLAALLWGDRGQEQARASLRQALSELRALGAVPPLINADRKAARLDAGALETELSRYERVALADDTDALARELDREPATLFADLDGASPDFDDWLRAERLIADERRVELAAAAAERALERGDHAGLAQILPHLERLAPADERVARVAMRADAAARGSGAVERRYQRLREELKRAFDVAPSAETTALYRALRGGRDARATSEPSFQVTPTLPAKLDVEPPQPDAKPWWRRIGRRGAAVAAALLILVAIGAAWVLVPRGQGAAEPATIAVLPFRDLSSGEDYFAEGVAEEILAQLSGEPGLQVAGRTSSWLFGDGTVDAREIGRRLDVDYILEGSVRRDGDRVRVDVTLVDTANGMRLWSHPFEGSLDDIFSIQRDIGREIRERLQLQLVHAAPEPDSHATSGEVYATWLIARGLLRTRDQANMSQAVDLLRRAVRQDPDFAPAWSSLGAALWLTAWNDFPGRRAEAMRHVRHALGLAPDLPQAHATLGMMLEGDPSAIRHLERAVRLDPGNAEAWYWLSGARNYANDFEGALAAVRRAAAIDPFWIRSSAFAGAAWDMGYREEAARFDRRIIRDHPEPAHGELARARMAARRGDWSAFVLHNRRAAQLDARGEITQQAELLARIGMLRLGFRFEPQVVSPVTTLWSRVMRGEIPSLERVPGAIERPLDFWRLPEISQAAALLLLVQDRGPELLALYDGAFASPDAMSDQHDLLYFAPLLAIAMREAGRTGEAERMLALADGRVRAVLARDRAPLRYHVLAARIWATMGRREQAMAALDRAVARGWPIAMSTGSVDIWIPRPLLDEDPAFGAISDDPRFRRIDAAIRANLARERREVEAMMAAG